MITLVGVNDYYALAALCYVLDVTDFVCTAKEFTVTLQRAHGRLVLNKILMKGPKSLLLHLLEYCYNITHPST